MTEETQNNEETKEQQEIIDGETTPEVEETTTGETGGEEKKKRKSRVTFENKLYDIIIAIQNSINDPLILQYMGVYNYGESRLKQGLELAKDARNKYNDQKAARANFLAKSNEARAKKEKADRTYMYLVKIIRLAFGKNNDIMQRLGLKGKRRRDIGGWTAQTGLFYKNVIEIPELIEELGRHSVTTEDLTAGETEVQEAGAAYAAKMSAKGDAEKATESKNKAFAKVRRWWRNFLKIAHIAMADDPQMKEKLGIVVPFETFN